MNTRQMIDDLRDQAARCTAAADALENNAKPAKRGRKLSAAAKRHISEMMKKKWAERKRALGTASKKPSHNSVTPIRRRVA